MTALLGGFGQKNEVTLIERIDAALERVTSGHAPMRIPAEGTDVDLVLADARKAVEVLEAINGALNMGLPAAEVLDENSPIRDAMRDVLMPPNVQLSGGQRPSA